MREATPQTARLLTYRRLHELTDIPIGTLARWVAEDRVPYIRFGDRTVRFDEAEILEWIARHRVEAREWRRDGGAR